MRFIAGALLLAVIVGAGAASRAQAALPGDWLYPVKTSLNEPLERLLARGAAGKARVDMQEAQTRLAEARALAERSGGLSTAQQSMLAQSFTVRALAASSTVAALGASGDWETAALLAAQWHASLASQVSLLAADASQGSIAKQASLAPVLVAARKALAAASSASVAAQARAVALGTIL